MADTKKPVAADTTATSQQPMTPAEIQMMQDAKDKKEAQRRDQMRPNLGEKKYKKGGYVRAADGVVKRGKTRGRML